MKHPAPRSPAAEILSKVAALERRQGLKDHAVVGGFARFVRKKLSDLPDPPRDLLVQTLRSFQGYEKAPVSRRAQAVEALFRLLGTHSKSPVKQFDPLPRPPPPAATPRPQPTEPSKAPVTSDSSLQYLKGVGPKRAQQLSRLGLESRRDFLYHLPLRYEDHSQLVSLREVRAGETVTFVARVRSGRAQTGRFRRGARFEATLEDDTGSLEAVFFGQAYLAKVLTPGIRAVFHGKAATRKGLLQLQTPSFELLEDGDTHRGGLVPIYPLTDGLYQKSLRILVHRAVDDLAGQEPEVLPPSLLGDLPPLSQALEYLHRPQDATQASSGRARLAYEELLVLQVALALKQRHEQRPNPKAIVIPRGDRVARLRAALPFSLTGAQDRAVRDILADMAAPRAMARLLQGDVGSGKTVVAAAALAATIDAGQQAALMAPTELLAEQHARTLATLLAPTGIEPALLTGSTPKAARKPLLEALEAGEAPLLLGTHALIEKAVKFQRLGLIVIDEQHRFGVGQRARLASKMGTPNTLVMTATPIPRTLSLTLYGDLDLTLLDEMPPGRTPVATTWKRPKTLPKIWATVRKQLDKGAQAYVVCPLVEESEKLEAQAATELAEELANGPFEAYQVGLLHGRMKRDEKEAVMHRFRTGALHLLVATTVIEVGVDVPNASAMVILNAERFGLAQLHQLRGRVGRGKRASTCVLVSQGGGEDTRRRLGVLTASTDGFKVAEEDLAIRGPGEYFGTRQAGLPELRFADLGRDTVLLERARRQARDLVDEDPALSHPQLESLRTKVHAKFARFLEGRH